ELARLRRFLLTLLMLPRIARLHACGRTIRMNDFYSLFRILLRNQSLRRNIHEVGISEKRFSIYESQFFGFNHPVNDLSGIATESLEIKIFDQTQFLQQHVTARIGRRLIDGVAAIARANGLFPAAPPLGQIRCRQQASLRLAESDYST